MARASPKAAMMMAIVLTSGLSAEAASPAEPAREIAKPDAKTAALNAMAAAKTLLKISDTASTASAAGNRETASSAALIRCILVYKVLRL